MGDYITKPCMVCDIEIRFFIKPYQMFLGYMEIAQLVLFYFFLFFFFYEIRVDLNLRNKIQIGHHIKGMNLLEIEIRMQVNQDSPDI